MQRVMTLVGCKRYAFSFEDGRTATGWECHFTRDLIEGEGQEVYFGRLSDRDCPVHFVVGDKYIVVSDKPQGKLMAFLPVAVTE